VSRSTPAFPAKTSGSAANTIVSRRKAIGVVLLLHQFQSPVVYLLGAAAALAFYFGELEEGGAIVAVLVVNALIGLLTELKAARSIEALRALGTRTARVRRDGHVRLIPAAELVPGDIVLLEAGDAISADLRLVEASTLAADESTLTGESVPSTNTRIRLSTMRASPTAPRCCSRALPSRAGSGIGVVVATGLATELGRVSQLVEEAEPGSAPLERKLARLSAQLVLATLALTAVIGGLGLTTGRDTFLIIQATIALAVAAIPEGLPIVATLALARGMWRMARQNALIERLTAVETLGATTVILTDKTGTLTENRMTVHRLWVPSGEIELAFRAGDGNSHRLASDLQLAQLLEIAVLCNNATLEGTQEEGSGDSMELALLRAGLQQVGLRRSALIQTSPIVRTYAFDTTTKMMTTVHSRGGRFFFAIKGAPEAVLAASVKVIADDGDSPLDLEARREWLARVEEFAHHGLRVLACAIKTSSTLDESLYENLTLMGLIGLEDPARADVPEAIRQCREAGIRVVMVTGDHAVTARSIGRAVGLGPGAANVAEGKQLAELGNGKDSKLFDVGIFARVSPSEKLDLVRVYQSAGEVVAMTGDGVNDAPALRQADIGVAMGLRGTDVAREAAAMILLDDAFPTIVKAIREGRVIFGNIRRFVAYLLSCNLSEVLVVGLAVISTLPLPLLPLQILYLNLVIDVFPAFALAMGEGEPGILRRPPRDPREPILGRVQWIAIALHSLALAASTFGALAVARLWLDLDARSEVTVTFLTLAFAQLFHVFNMRHPRSGLVGNEVTRNPWLWASLLLCTVLLAVPPYLPPAAHVLHLVPPSPAMWATILGLSITPLLATQAVVCARPLFRSRPQR
jgi:Ca2+-transporting ATPase